MTRTCLLCAGKGSSSRLRSYDQGLTRQACVRVVSCTSGGPRKSLGLLWQVAGLPGVLRCRRCRHRGRGNRVPNRWASISAGSTRRIAGKLGAGGPARSRHLFCPRRAQRGETGPRGGGDAGERQTPASRGARVVQPRPTSPLEVIQAKLLAELLMPLLTRPPRFPGAGEITDGGCSQIAQIE